MKVLYVEDNPNDIDLLRREFKRSKSGITLVAASTINEAKQKIQTDAGYSLILIDMRLPDGNGLDLLSYIRRNDIRLPAIILTSYGDEDDAVNSISAGADDYIPKKEGFYSQVADSIKSAIERFNSAEKQKISFIKVLYIEHNNEDIFLTQRHIARYRPYIQIEYKKTFDEIEETASDVKTLLMEYDVILLDYRLPGRNAIEILKIIIDQSQHELPVIILTGQGDEETASQVLKMGAYDYIVKNPGYLFRVPNIIQSAYDKAQLIRQQKELVEKEEQLREKNEYLTKLLKYSNIPIIVWNPSFEVTHFNKAFERITGYQASEVMEGGLDLIIPAKGHQRTFSAILETAKGDQWENREMSIRTKEGKQICLLWNSANITDKNNEKVIATIAQGMDITEKKAEIKKVTYLSVHDHLTGLYNRVYYEGKIRKLNNARNLPLTVVYSDLNGLKLANDAYGYAAGDELLKIAAKVFKSEFRKTDTVIRMGGDEFVVLMTKASTQDAEIIIQRIRSRIAQIKVKTVELSISFGIDTKNNDAENIVDVLKNAENRMFRVKLFEGPSMRGKTIYAIINTLHEKNKREEMHSRRVSKICENVGKSLNLSESNINDLVTVGLLHDIGKVAIEEAVLNKPGSLTGEEWESIKRHPEIGYRILSAVNDMADLAEFVLYHHERWDGKGYPKGLKGEKIPLQSRIIAIADAYDAMTSPRPYRESLSVEVARNEILINAGKQFDPTLAKLFLANDIT